MRSFLATPKITSSWCNTWSMSLPAIWLILLWGTRNLRKSLGKYAYNYSGLLHENICIERVYERRTLLHYLQVRVLGQVQWLN